MILQDLANHTQQLMENCCSLGECLSGDQPRGKAWVSIAHSSGHKTGNVCTFCKVLARKRTAQKLEILLEKL